MVIRVASYNTALSRANTGDLLAALKSGQDRQVLSTIKLLQHIHPDIILLNEVDYDETGELVALLQQNLRLSGLNLPFSFCRSVNTGMPSGRDFDRDGMASDKGADALGFGDFPGQYGMVLLSRFPINEAESRTFQHFLWRDMPKAKLPHLPDGTPWYNQGDLAVLPLSSKSHWDVAVEVEGQILRCLCSHPTPPVFDGIERRNACRNHDEIRFWSDYLSAKEYFYDDQGRRGGASGSPFVLLGDLNASPVEGESCKESIQALLTHPRIIQMGFPKSKGALEHSPDWDSSVSVHHTAVWRKQVDYVLVDHQILRHQQAVFWPNRSSPLFPLIENTSDHRLVYEDIEFFDK